MPHWRAWRTERSACEVCRGSVEPDRLLADPLSRVPGRPPAEAAPGPGAGSGDGRPRAGDALPPVTSLFDGWEIHCHYQPRGPVSGDYYDLIRSGTARPDPFRRRAGKGVPPPAHVAPARHVPQPGGLGAGPDTLVAQANRIWRQHERGRLRDALRGRLAGDGTVELVNAGHWPALLTRDGRVRPAGHRSADRPLSAAE